MKPNVLSRGGTGQLPGSRGYQRGRTPGVRTPPSRSSSPRPSRRTGAWWGSGGRTSGRCRKNGASTRSINHELHGQPACVSRMNRSTINTERPAPPCWALANPREAHLPMSRRSDHTAPDYRKPRPSLPDPMHMEFQGQVDPDLTSPPARKRRHVFRWVFLAVQVLFLAWVISGATSGSGTPANCVGMVGDALKTCQDAGHAGTAIGVGLVIGVWAAVDFILAVTYLIFRRRA